MEDLSSANLLRSWEKNVSNSAGGSFCSLTSSLEFWGSMRLGDMYCGCDKTKVVLHKLTGAHYY